MKNIVMKRLQCKEAHAEIIASDLKQLSPELQPLLDRWIEENHCEDAVLYGGYSLDMLMKEKGMYFTGAILTLDWIIKEPEKALEALAQPIC